MGKGETDHLSGKRGKNMSDEIKGTVTGQLGQLQTLMHRMAFHSYMGQGKAAHNPYRGQGRVLAALKGKPEISQKELTGLLDMSKQSLAELLAKLEKSGFIAREPSEDDKRSVTIRLLEKGKKAAEEMDENTMDVLQIFDCLDEAELAQFSGYLSRIIQRCAETFSGESLEERSHRMEKFLSHNNFSFSQCDPESGYSGRHAGHKREKYEAQAEE